MEKIFQLLILSKEQVMKYNCKIISVEEEEVTVQIDKISITGFVNCGVDKNVGQETSVEISLYDDLNITPCDDKVGLERKHKSFEYSLWGILDIQNGVLKSVIDFEIDENEIFDYGYLDGKYVKIDVLRLDFEF